MRLRYLIALLLLVPLADALFLVVVADYLGWQVTVALVVLTALLGMLLVRAEGRHTLRRIQRKAARGQPPTNELLDGGLLIAAGAFLLTPGLVTDAIGFLLAFPPTRIPIRAGLKKFVVVPYLDKQTDGFVTGNVWVGGFPNGDGNGGGFQGFGDFGDFDGFGPGGDGQGGVGSRTGDTGDDAHAGGSSAVGNSSAAGGSGDGRRGGSTDNQRQGSDGDDVVDVDYSVEDDERDRDNRN